MAAPPNLPSYDVLAVGESMVRLSPPGRLRLEQATSLDVQVGGSESNTLVGLARLGLRAAWVSRLTRNAWGRRIAGDLASHGVDVSQIVWTDEGRVGCYYLEQGAGARASSIIYDRQGSAMSRMGPEHMDFGLVSKARLLHLSGITPALSPNCRRLIEALAVEANQRGVLLSFDVNYRSRLWSPSQAAEALAPLCSRADVLFVTRGDAATVFGATGDPTSVLRALRARFGARLTVLTLGREGAAAVERGGAVHSSPALATDEVDRLGGGDAFSAGFLCAYLSATGTGLGPQHGAEAGGESDAVASGLRYGAALAALKYTIPGDVPVFTREEVEALLAGSNSGIVR